MCCCLYWGFKVKLMFSLQTKLCLVQYNGSSGSSPHMKPGSFYSIHEDACSSHGGGSCSLALLASYQNPVGNRHAEATAMERMWTGVMDAVSSASSSGSHCFSFLSLHTHTCQTLSHCSLCWLHGQADLVLNLAFLPTDHSLNEFFLIRFIYIA